MNIGVVGCGNMGGALINGLCDEYNVNIFNTTFSKMDRFEGVNKYEDVSLLIDDSDIIILAIKPHQYEAWLKQNPIGDKVLLSIAAGITSDFLSEMVEKYVITMPNVASSINLGHNIIVDNGQDFLDTICDVFNVLGTYSIIKEDMLKEYILLSGSSPAFFYYLIDAYSKRMEAMGIDYDEAVDIYANVMQSSAAMIKNRNCSVSDLVDSVCSKGGVTIAAIDSLNNNNVDKHIGESLTCAYNRALEMENNDFNK